jgi:hypothetical protein
MGFSSMNVEEDRWDKLTANPLMLERFRRAVHDELFDDGGSAPGEAIGSGV